MDFEFEYDPGGEFGLDLNRIQNSTNVMAVARQLASQIKSKSYITMKEFLESLSDSDLKYMIDKIEENNEYMKEVEDDGAFCQGFEDVLLMSMMMTSAEGLNIGDVEEIRDRLNRFVLILVCESLSRKGFVKFYRENATLGDEFDDKILVEAKGDSDE